MKKLKKVGKVRYLKLNPNLNRRIQQEDIVNYEKENIQCFVCSDAGAFSSQAGAM